jgi:AcrR family transcriptional regulator
MSNAFTSQPASASRRGYHHGNLAEALIDAARFLIAEKGPQGFTLIEAARLVNVSPAAPYRHYKDRAALVAAVARRGFQLFAERLAGATRQSGPPRDQLLAMGVAYLAFSREEPGYYGAMFGAASMGPPPLPGTGAGDSGAFGLLVETVRRAIADPADATAPGSDPTALALEIWALSHGIASLAGTGQWPIHNGTAPPETVLQNATVALLDARRRAPSR